MGNVRLLLFICIFRSIVAIPDRDCPQLQVFVSHYSKLLNQMPVQTYPVNNFCSFHNTTFHYSQAVEWFQYATTNKTCDLDFNQNRLNVIQRLFDQMSSIWDDAHCADCVSNKNDTAQFMELYEYQLNCTKFHEPNPCEICSGFYTELQRYYEGLVKSRKGIVCFDIEDRMNQTRHAWSAKYNCCKGKQHSKMAFIGFASAISSLPVIFYVAMYFITRIKENRERAAAPLLNDEAVEETEEEQPHASTSYPPQQLQKEQVDDSKGSQRFVEEEPKINNLNITRGVREGDLIDISNSESKTNHSQKDLKLPADTGDDDVSLLGARNYLN
ncbi:uncharacterized protein LOC134209687 [Armigeres subalbatus]|uniref:uncharacterized protein LOC134209687 n=1 Tax=Armigeres subalbatus TaxID=124917 RepID=UPI002ED60733